MEVRFRTKNGWLLTEKASKMIINQLYGEAASIDEIAQYVSTQYLGSDPVVAVSDSDSKLPFIRPTRYYVGCYDVFPNKDGVVATKEY